MPTGCLALVQETLGLGAVEGTGVCQAFVLAYCPKCVRSIQCIIDLQQLLASQRSIYRLPEAVLDSAPVPSTHTEVSPVPKKIKCVCIYIYII